MTSGDGRTTADGLPQLPQVIAYYILQGLLIGVVGMIRLFVPAVNREEFFLFLTLSVLLSAGIGGMGPGLLATILGAALEWRLSFPPGWSVVLFVFILTGVAVSLLTGPLRLAVRRAVERQRRETLDAIPTFAAILEPDGIVKEINLAGLETAALNRQDVVGKLFYNAYWWSHSAELQQGLQRSIAESAAGESVCLQATLRQGPDRFLPVEITFSFRAGSVIATAQDISQRITAKSENDALRGRVESSESVLTKLGAEGRRHCGFRLSLAR